MGSGILLLVFSSLLLDWVIKHHKKSVLKMIKTGCLVIAILELILCSAWIPVLVLVTVNEHPLLSIILVWFILTAILTISVIYGIAMVKPKIVSVYIYFTGVSLILIFLLMAFVASFLPILIIPFFLIILYQDYILNFFVLHLNAISIPSAGSQHHL